MHGWVCPSCNSLWDIGGAFIRYVAKRAKKEDKKRDPDTDPDWTGSCENCGESPIVPATGMPIDPNISVFPGSVINLSIPANTKIPPATRRRMKGPQSLYLSRASKLIISPRIAVVEGYLRVMKQNRIHWTQRKNALKTVKYSEQRKKVEHPAPCGTGVPS